MEKINIAELLRDCPKGMELDCTIYENVEFDYIEQSPESRYPIRCLIKTNIGYTTLILTSEGCNDRHTNAKCVIFPKGKTTWEGFQRPFKDGDVVFYDDNIAIFKEWGDATLFRTYAKLYIHRESIDIDFPLFGKYVRKETRFATEEEKQKLFAAIKENGYKWNPKTKTLEKLIKPKFNVGDVIQDEDGYKVTITEVNVGDELYGSESMIGKWIGGIFFSEQDNWELVPNKFDITTLKPFDRVLTRITTGDVWGNDFFGYYKDRWFHCSGHIAVHYCIPYEGNEHLLGTTNDCDNYYKIWE